MVVSGSLYQLPRIPKSLNLIPYLFLLAFAGLISCNQESAQINSTKEDTAVPDSAERSFLIIGTDTIPTGVSIPVKGKWIDPDSVAKPKTIPFRGKTKVVHAKTNIHSVGTPKVVPVPKELTVITPGEDGVPLPTKVPARGKVLPVLHSPPEPASPFAGKDNAKAGFQYL